MAGIEESGTQDKDEKFPRVNRFTRKSSIKYEYIFSFTQKFPSLSIRISRVRCSWAMENIKKLNTPREYLFSF